MLPTLWFRIGWAVLFVVGLIWEFLAIFDKEKGDTATEQIRWLLQYPPAWYAGAGILLWFIDHFLLHDAIFRFLWNLGR